MSGERPVSAAHAVSDFDARAAGWDDDPTKVERARAIAAAIVREVPLVASMSALEYGAGTGLLGFMLRDRIGDLTLADVSAGMLEVATRKIAATGDPRVRAIRLDLLADPVPDARFDLVFSAMTLHHIPDTAGILRAFRSILRTPGFLCIADLDSEDGSFHGAGFDGHRGFDRAALGALARAAGFASVVFSTAYEMKKTAAGGTRTFPIFLMVARTGP
jgi:ubiquinone/menaquinone biosynthesis C-methylase UbiE